jgi:hypothetical protein
MPAAPNTEGTSNPAALVGGQFGAVVGSSDGPTTFQGNNIVASSTIADLPTLKAYLVTLGLLK